jgi:hypothetical protein
MRTLNILIMRIIIYRQKSVDRRKNGKWMSGEWEVIIYRQKNADMLKIEYRKMANYHFWAKSVDRGKRARCSNPY